MFAIRPPRINITPKTGGFYKQIGMILIALCLLPMMATGQELPRLHPVRVTKMAPVPKDTTRYDRNSPEYWDHVLDSPRMDFFECRNDEGVVGYLMTTTDSARRTALEKRFRGRLLDGAWLAEVQRAEEVMAEVLDLKADSAQRICEVFTAPRYYRFTRQYLFFLDKKGDTCAFVNCMMDDEVSHPERSFVDVSDGDDNYWRVVMNLSQRRLVHTGLNGPTIKMVDGRSREPRGLDTLSIFCWIGGNKRYFDCDYDALPKSVRSRLPEAYHIDGMTTYDGFHFDGKDYYIVYYSDGTEVGLDRRGHWRYLHKRDSVTMEEISQLTGSTRVYETVVNDMAARGRDFHRYGWVQAVECVKDCFLVEVYYFPSKDLEVYGNANDMYALYTIDPQGRVVGIVH